MIQINRGRVNLALSTSAFAISSAGSVLLHIVFAMAIYAETRSGLMTSLFISLQWLPMLIVILYRSDWEHGMNPRKRWYILDIVSAVLTLPILFFIADSHYLAIVLILLARGVIDHINRINKTVACRFLFPAEKSTHYASFLQSGYHFGIGAAAVVGIFFAQHVDLETVVIIDALTFLVSAALIAFSQCLEHADLPETVSRKSLRARISEYKESLQGDPRLLFCAILPPLTATFFQGTYSVLQPIFPVEQFDLGSSAVSASYVLASIAIIAGSSGFSLFCKHYNIFDKPFLQTRLLVLVLSLGAAVFYIGTAVVPSPEVSAALFTLMVFLFEFTWMVGYGGIVAFAPKGQLGSVFGISFAIGCILASALAAVFGILLDVLENDFVTLISLLMLMYMTVIIAAGLAYRASSTEAPSGIS